MSGLTDARAELKATLEAAPASQRVYAEPSGSFAAPCVRLHPASPWLAPSALAAGRRTQRWEVWVVLGKLDSRARYKTLEAMVSAVTMALDKLPSWSAIQWDRPAPTDMGGVNYLAVRGVIETNREV